MRNFGSTRSNSINSLRFRLSYPGTGELSTREGTRLTFDWVMVRLRLYKLHEAENHGTTNRQRLLCWYNAPSFSTSWRLHATYGILSGTSCHTCSINIDCVSCVYLTVPLPPYRPRTIDGERGGMVQYLFIGDMVVVLQSMYIWSRTKRMGKSYQQQPEWTCSRTGEWCEMVQEMW